MGEDGKASKPGLTIVGGQPSKRKKGKRFPDKIEVPVGLEKLLFHAARDAAFRARFLSDREAAIAQTGIRLRPSEWAMLRAVPDSALRAMIERVVPENPRRRKFMRLVSAAAASLAAGTAALGCDDCGGETTRGIGPDTDVDTDTDTDTDTDVDTDSDTDTVETDTGTTDYDGIGPDTDVDGDTDTDVDSDTDSDTDTGR